MKKAVPILLFILALGVRLGALFFITNPQNPGTGWYTDVFHHWQIAYLTKEIGLSQGKFWDLMGMEYFWGAGQTILITLLMLVTGSTNIVMLRLLSTLAGAGSTAVLFGLGKRYWGIRAGLAIGLFYALNPVSVFTDQSGLQVSMAILLLLAGMWWLETPLVAGLLWGLAGTFRASFWLLGGGLTVATVYFKKNFDKLVFLFLGFGAVSLVYMKFLLDHTGNPIYPIWWNLKGNLAGEWNSYQPPGLFQGELLIVHNLAVGLLVTGAAVGLATVRKKGKAWPVMLFGAAELLILGMMAFTSYSWNYTLERFWVSRLWSWPDTFLALLIVVGWFGWAVKRGNLGKVRDLFWPMLAGGLAVIWLVAWPVIWRGYKGEPLPGTQTYEWELVERRAQSIGINYGGGKFLVPSSRPDVIYLLVRDWGVEGKNLVSQQFDVMAYMEEDPLANWGKDGPQVMEWLKEEEIKYVLADEESKYRQVAELEPEHLIPHPTGEGYIVYEVR